MLYNHYTQPEKYYFELILIFFVFFFLFFLFLSSSSSSLNYSNNCIEPCNRPSVSHDEVVNPDASIDGEHVSSATMDESTLDHTASCSPIWTGYRHSRSRSPSLTCYLSGRPDNHDVDTCLEETKTNRVEEKVEAREKIELVQDEQTRISELLQLDNKGNRDQHLCDNRVDGDDETQVRRLRPDDDAFQADGHELFDHNMVKVEADLVEQRQQPHQLSVAPQKSSTLTSASSSSTTSTSSSSSPSPTTSRTCSCSTKGGKQNGTNIGQLHSACNASSNPTILYCWSSSPTADGHVSHQLTAACDHEHNDSDSENDNDDNANDDDDQDDEQRVNDRQREVIERHDQLSHQDYNNSSNVRNIPTQVDTSHHQPQQQQRDSNNKGELVVIQRDQTCQQANKISSNSLTSEFNVLCRSSSSPSTIETPLSDIASTQPYSLHRSLSTLPSTLSSSSTVQIIFGNIRSLKHLPRLRSSIIQFEPKQLSTCSIERFIVRIKSILCDQCLQTNSTRLVPFHLLPFTLLLVLLARIIKSMFRSICIWV